MAEEESGDETANEADENEENEENNQEDGEEAVVDLEAEAEGEGEEGEEDSDEDDDGDEDPLEFEDFEDYGMRPLYQNAPLSVRESAAAMLSFMVSHNLSASCVEDLINLIQLHCQPEGFVKLSLYKLKKYFHFKPADVKKIYYCSVCQGPLENPEDICRFCVRRNHPLYFIQNPLIPQIQKLFSRPNFHANMQHRFARGRFNIDNYEDIYDGQVYKGHVQQGFLREPNNLSMTFYTDGVPVFQSKNYSFWPFFLTINELPYKERMRRENTLLAGLWFGPKKPHANLFVKSFRDDLEQLYNGVRIYVADLHNYVVVRGMLIAGVADLPAKSTFYNVVAHNGYHGCTVCEIGGEQIVLANGNETHVYRWEPAAQKRTLERIYNQAREAQAANLADFNVMGVKGPCALRLIMPNFLRGSAIDLMHLIMGIVRKLLILLFDSHYANDRFSLRDVLHVVDRLLLGMKPPRFVHRYPRSLEDLCHWKASELKLWLFYYSVPILKEVMSAEYFDHYLKLVIGLSYLSAPSISEQMLEQAAEVLNQFVRDFPNLYGLRYCTISVHMLVHVADCVRELGPAWVYSCFPYENMNGQYLRVIHGKTNVDSQITRMHAQMLDLPRKLHFLNDGPVKAYCTQRKGHLKISDRINASCYVVGCYKHRDNDVIVMQALRNANIRYTQVKTYERLLKDSLVYVGEAYTRDMKSSSSFVAYHRGDEIGFGSIHKFVKVMDCNCNVECHCGGTHYAIIKGIDKGADIRLLNYRLPNLNLKYMSRVTFNLDVTPVSYQSLKTVCFFMRANHNCYIAEPVNPYEVE